MSPNPWPNDGEQTYTPSAEAMCCLLLLSILLAPPGICETWRIAQHQYPWFWKAAFMPQQMSVPWPWHEFYLYSLCYIINKRLWLSCFVSIWVERKVRPWMSNHLTHRLFMPRLKSLCVGDAMGGAQAQGLASHCATTFYHDFCVCDIQMPRLLGSEYTASLLQEREFWINEEARRVPGLPRILGIMACWYSCRLSIAASNIP